MFSKVSRNSAIYWQVILTSLKEGAQYRVNMLVSFAFTLVSLGAFVLFWRAAYGNKPGPTDTIAGYTLPQMISYYILTTWVSELNASDRNIWRPSADISSSRLSGLLLYPIATIPYYFAVDLASNLPYSMVGVSLLVGFGLTFDLPFVLCALTPLSLLLCALSLALGYMLAFAIGLLRSAPTFWFESPSGFNRTVDWIVLLFSGSLLPLGMLPSSLHHFSLWLPFQYLVFFPVSVCLGKVMPADAVRGLLVGTVWVFMASLALGFTWRAGLRRYTSTGG